MTGPLLHLLMVAIVAAVLAAVLLSSGLSLDLGGLGSL
jgi:hypothetical protein